MVYSCYVMAATQNVSEVLLLAKFKKKQEREICCSVSFSFLFLFFKRGLKTVPRRNSSWGGQIASIYHNCRIENSLYKPTLTRFKVLFSVSSTNNNAKNVWIGILSYKRFEKVKEKIHR